LYKFEEERPGEWVVLLLEITMQRASTTELHHHYNMGLESRPKEFDDIGVLYLAQYVNFITEFYKASQKSLLTMLCIVMEMIYVPFC